MGSVSVGGDGRCENPGKGSAPSPSEAAGQARMIDEVRELLIGRVVVGDPLAGCGGSGGVRLGVQGDDDDGARSGLLILHVNQRGSGVEEENPHAHRKHENRLVDHLLQSAVGEGGGRVPFRQL